MVFIFKWIVVLNEIDALSRNPKDVGYSFET